MYTRAKLVSEIKSKKSFLCVGLDTDPGLIPKSLKGGVDPVFAFNKAIIDATQHLCVSYKINTAFYEAEGSRGWDSMQRTFEYLPKNCFRIADAKRGDIGNTANQYARAFYDTLGADAVTLSPYMGNDTILPFLSSPGKWGIVLALTSNPGSAEYEQQKVGNDFLFERVLTNTSSVGTTENLMFVIGATKPAEFQRVRSLVPDHFLLVPGIGAQGGNLEEVFNYGKNADVGLLVNASRSIIYASDGTDFAEAAAREAQKIQQQMAELARL